MHRPCPSSHSKQCELSAQQNTHRDVLDVEARHEHDGEHGHGCDGHGCLKVCDGGANEQAERLRDEHGEQDGQPVGKERLCRRKGKGMRARR